VMFIDNEGTYAVRVRFPTGSTWCRWTRMK
jgi:hypothetical protein